MSFSYDPTLSNTVSKIRFRIGDKSEPALLTDEEILAQFDMCSSNIDETSAVLCENLAAEFAKKCDQSVGSVSINYSQLSVRFSEIAASIRRSTQKNAVGIPWLGGSSIDEMETEAERTDINQPNFVINMMKDQ